MFDCLMVRFIQPTNNGVFMKELFIGLLATLLLLTVATHAKASVECSPTQYYSPELGLVVNSMVCIDSSVSDDEIDDSEEVEETVIGTRSPVKGETGYKE